VNEGFNNLYGKWVDILLADEKEEPKGKVIPFNRLDDKK
jgi:hypothetical protein